MRGTKIISTVGKTTSSKETITKLVQNGTNIIRLNMSHGSREEHLKTIKSIREIEKELGIFIGIAIDTKGPEIRIKLKKECLEIKKDEIVDFTNNSTIAGIFIDFPNFDKLEEKMILSVDDGGAQFLIEKICDGFVQTRVINNFVLKNGKGLNIPGMSLGLPIIGDEDKKDIDFGIENNVDFFFASFVGREEDVDVIKKYVLNKNGDQEIISKIESQQAMNNLDGLVSVSDGVMIARGDLCAEIGCSKLFSAQKRIAQAAHQKNKILICATQMMESMIFKNRPTRAEISDVGNAVLDGCDCVMLSGETAVGQFPCETVKTMSEVCKDAEIHNGIKEDVILIKTNSLKIVDSARKKYKKTIIIFVSENVSLLRKINIRKNCFGFFTNNFSIKMFEEKYNLKLKIIGV